MFLMQGTWVQGSSACCEVWSKKETNKQNVGTLVNNLELILIQFDLISRFFFFPQYGRSLLVTYFKYSSVYMSIPDSQSIPSLHALFSSDNHSLFSKSVSLFCK